MCGTDLPTIYSVIVLLNSAVAQPIAQHGNFRRCVYPITYKQILKIGVYTFFLSRFKDKKKLPNCKLSDNQRTILLGLFLKKISVFLGGV